MANMEMVEPQKDKGHIRGVKRTHTFKNVAIYRSNYIQPTDKMQRDNISYIVKTLQILYYGYIVKK